MKSYLEEVFNIQNSSHDDTDVLSPLKFMEEDSDEGRKIEGVRVGKIAGQDENGRFLVDLPGNRRKMLVSRITASVDTENLFKSGAGQEVLLAFENNDPELPIIIDMIHSLPDEASEKTGNVLEANEPEEVIIDGRKIIFDAKDEVVIKCGKASITLTKAGKILIKGAYLLSRSSGVNRIKGGSVQIN